MTSSAKTLLVLGGASDIGRMTARAFAAQGWTVRLAGRDLDALKREADDICGRGAGAASTHVFDALATSSFVAFADALPELPDVVLSVVGALGDQTRAASELDHAQAIMRANYEGPALILGLFAERFLARGAGTIVGVSSVSGDRGRASNYVYGSAKAGFSAFLSGLRNRGAKGGVHVLTVKPGFVRTRMTEGMSLPGLLTAEPQEVAQRIWRGVQDGKDVIYVRPIWRVVMAVISHIPEFIFKKMSL